MSTVTDMVVKGVSMSAMIESEREGMMKAIERMEARIQRIFVAAELLENAGLNSTLSKYSTYNLYIYAAREQLPAFRKALGKCQVATKSVKDPRKRILEIQLRFADHPDVTVVYEKKMPRRKKGEPDSIRCKIVRNVRVEHVLVCEKV